MFVPMMSAGIRSGVNWMRLNSRSSASASVRTSSVLPRPGTPSSSAVAADEQAGQHAVDDLRVPDDDLRDFVVNRLVTLGELRRAGFDGGADGHWEGVRGWSLGAGGGWESGVRSLEETDANFVRDDLPPDSRLRTIPLSSVSHRVSPSEGARCNHLVSRPVSPPPLAA